MKNDGFAIVMMLIVLLSAGAYLSIQQVRYLPSSEHHLSRLATLVKAKQSLLHYTNSYSDLYGPRGAGPGHLPCPDTDAHPDGERVSAASSPFVGDSPDPPCGGGEYTFGHLPRHVSLVDTRFAFHFEPQQNVRYRVATTHVNNPVNRVVNANHLSEHSLSPEVARLVFPPLRLLHQNDLFARDDPDVVSLPIFEKDLLRVSKRRVNRWFSDLYERNREQSCQSLEQCNAVPEHLARCHSSTTLAFNGILWLIPRADESTCVVLQLEHTDLNRHWFIRNRWLDGMTISIHEQCQSAHYLDCEIVSVSDHELMLMPRRDG